MEEVQTVRRPTIRQVNILYLAIMALFIGGGAILQRYEMQLRGMSYGEKMFLISLTQLFFILNPALLLIYFKKLDVRSSLRINKISFVNILLSAAIILFTIPIEGFINLIILLVLRYFGKIHATPTFPAENFTQFLITLFVVAVTPAILEEILSRGVIFKGYEGKSLTAAFVMSSLMFAVLHRDIQSLAATFILGFLIAYLSYRANSIFAGMVAHFTNNGLIVFMTYMAVVLKNFLEKNMPGYSEQLKNAPQNADPFANLTTQQIVIAVAVLAGVAIFFALGLAGLIYLFRHTTRNIQRETRVSEAPIKERFAYTPLIIAFGLAVVFSYFDQLGINQYFKNIFGAVFKGFI